MFQDWIPQIEKSFVNLNVFEEHYRDVFASLAASGYDGIEGFLELPALRRDPKSLQSLLQEYDLRMPMVYANCLLHDPARSEKSMKNMLELARPAIEIGVRYFDINPEPSDYKKTNKEISFETSSIVRLAKELRDLGAILSIHYHDEMMQDDARELGMILENSDPDLVRLTLDFHWAFRAGIDPLGMLNKYSSRIVALHLRNSVNGIWTEALGVGEVDYPKAAAILEALNWNGLIVVELANEKGVTKNRSVEENHEISRTYVKEIFRK